MLPHSQKSEGLRAASPVMIDIKDHDIAADRLVTEMKCAELKGTSIGAADGKNCRSPGTGRTRVVEGERNGGTRLV